MRQHKVACHAASQLPNQMRKLNIINSPLLVVLIATLGYSKITFSAERLNQAQPRSYFELPKSGKLSAIPPTCGNEKPIESTSW